MAEQIYKISELKKDKSLGKEGEAIFAMTDSWGFKKFMEYILKDGRFEASEKGMFLNGKGFSNFLLNGKFKEASTHGVKHVIIEQRKLYVKMSDNEVFTVILD